MKLKFS